MEKPTEHLTLEQAADLLQSGEVVAIPTETVYGLAASIAHDQAIRRVFSLKGRPLINPLIVHLASAAQLNQVAREIPEEARLLAGACWPGPLTLVLPKQPGVSPLITAGGDTVAVRVPDHPLTRRLLALLPFPLAAPSANPSNYISPTRAEDVLRGLPELRGRILDGGPCQRGLESTVVGFRGGDVLLYRYGSLSRETLESILGKPLVVATRTGEVPASPGMLSRHYSPRTPLLVTRRVIDTLENLPAGNAGLLSFRTRYAHPRLSGQVVLSPAGSLEEAARNLFHSLHYLDTLGLDLIIAELLPDEGLGSSVNDRLLRAAAT
ncbi:MAG TPA: L-threonylcarbamoyladenylate synthase [Chitinophagaceae bacterium]|nr:L-threonylcarbamoyladenylate synthase [Chitinophagaceae bacterium]